MSGKGCDGDCKNCAVKKNIASLRESTRAKLARVRKAIEDRKKRLKEKTEEKK